MCEAYANCRSVLAVHELPQQVAVSLVYVTINPLPCKILLVLHVKIGRYLPGSAALLEIADTGRKHMLITEHTWQWQQGSEQ